MAPTETKALRINWLKTTLVVIGIALIATVGLHIWFVNNARGVLKQIVTTKSKGQLKLELSHLSFNFLTNKLQVRQADLRSTDSLSQPTTYGVTFENLTLHVGSFWPLLLQKKLLLDSIKLQQPTITVFQWRKDTTAKFAKEDLSLPQEMGKLYNSMLDALDGFGIRRIVINNASMSLVNKMKPGSEPVTVSNIFFSLVRTADNAKKRDEFIRDEQSVDLSTTHQNIALPGGRHRLAFRSFKLELFNKRIVLDSCTVTAVATDSSKSSYSIFFKSLALIGVDFEAMSKYNLIRADSVYCENPLFDINLHRSDAVSKKRETPDLERMVRELTGDLDLAFVGVKDAGIQIDISSSGKKQSLFNSNKDNFQMYGLRINADSATPVVVKRFDMLVRDYQLYNQDSSSAYSFDSIHFNNNKIALNNFTVTTTASAANKLRTKRNFSIPYFELTGLDWYQLLFEQNLKAQSASLFNPVIEYTRAAVTKNRKKTDLFTSLQSLDNLITLNNLRIINGQVNVFLAPSTSIQLKNANISVKSNQLLRSNNNEGLRRAVDAFSFSTGRIQVKDFTAQLQNVRYTGNNLIMADALNLSSGKSKLNASIKGVTITNMLLDDAVETIIVDGIKWQNAAVSLNPVSSSGGKSKSETGLLIKNIQGNNTQFSLKGKTTLTTFIQSLQVSSLIKEEARPLQINCLIIKGTNLNVDNDALQAWASSYEIKDGAPSYLSGVRLHRYQYDDSLTVNAPRLNFTANINSVLANQPHINAIELHTPAIRFIKRSVAQTTTEPNNSSLQIDRITLTEPNVFVAIHRADSVATIHLPKSEASRVTVSGLQLNNEGMHLDGLTVKADGATFVKRTGEVLGVEKGKVDLELANIRLFKQEGQPAWSAVINALYLQNPNSLAFGKKGNKLQFDQLSIGNLALSSDYVKDVNRLLKFNISAWLRTTTGQYIDSTTTLKWYNADYNYTNRTLSLDSFLYHPTQPRDSVIAATPYQTDYITFKSGPIKLFDFSLDKYEKDSAFLADVLTITKPVITIYRDKTPPFLEGRLKPLPADMIRNIELPVSVNSVNLVGGTLAYTEKNAKNGAEGTLVLTHITGGLQNIKNFNYSTTDSLTLTLNAYLMDSALLNLRVRQSYIDSMGGFLMNLRMRPTTLAFLNPVLAPLSNVIITSGTIDSLHLRAIGRKDAAVGYMNMYYRKLRIKLVKDGNPDESSFMGNVASFLANTFVIRKNNDGRTGMVYFKRLPDRSFFNYIIKTTFSGMATSIGVKSNRKYEKQYRRQLSESGLPPIPVQ